MKILFILLTFFSSLFPLEYFEYDKLSLMSPIRPIDKLGIVTLSHWQCNDTYRNSSLINGEYRNIFFCNSSDIYHTSANVQKFDYNFDKNIIYQFKKYISKFLKFKRKYTKFDLASNSNYRYYEFNSLRIRLEFCPVNSEKPEERQIFSTVLNTCVGDCTDKCSNKWGFEDGTCIDCSSATTREEAANCFCSSQGLPNPNHSVVINGQDGNNTYSLYTKCGETAIQFKVFEPGCKNNSDNSDNNNTNPPGGGGSDDNNSTNPNPPGGGGGGGDGGSGDGGGVSDDNSTNPNLPGGGGGGGDGGSGDGGGVSDDNSTNPNPPGGGDGGSDDNNSTNPNPPGGGGSGDQNFTKTNIDKEANKIGADLSKKIDDMSKSFLDERGVYQQEFDNFKKKIESDIETIKKGFIPLKKNQVTTCNFSQSFEVAGHSIPFQVDICKQLSIFYNVFYFLSFFTFMFFGLKFLIHIVFIFMSGV